MRTLNQLIEAATETQLRLWMADVAESVVRLYEIEYHDDVRLSNVIRVVRRYATGDATDAELKSANEAAWAIGVECSWYADAAPSDVVAATRANRCWAAVNSSCWAAKDIDWGYASAVAWAAAEAAPDRVGQESAMDRYTALLTWYLDGATGDKPSIEMGDKTNDPN